MNISEESKKKDEIEDGENGVVCWFYVYKQDASNKPSICGIVIIKQLTDIVTDNNQVNSSSSLSEKNIFFYIETKFKLERDENFSAYSSPDTVTRNIETYTNDTLIKKFIDTPPNNAAIIQFIISTPRDTVYVGKYSELSDFLKDLIDQNFDM